jgi:hypothetical protein
MADVALNGSSQLAGDFVEDSSLSYIIPASTQFDVEQAFSDASSRSHDGLLASIEKRESLFFGEMPFIPFTNIPISFQFQMLIYLLPEPR